MDAVESQPSTAPTLASTSTSRPAYLYSPARTPISPRGPKATRDSQTKRISPSSVAPGGGNAHQALLTPKATPRTTRKPSVSSRRLVPITERKPQEDKPVTRPRKDSETQGSEIGSDGTPLGRGGRHFAVANVGNNGRIYLKPTVRPANQRYQQPNFTFPSTPPATAALEAFNPDKHGKADQPDASDLRSTLWSPLPGESPMSHTDLLNLDIRSPLSHAASHSHRRAVSDSTIQDPSVTGESDAGAFKVVITRPQEDKRPHTMEDLDPSGMPHLNVNIPTWKLGTPRFNSRGMPLIRGSSYAPTEDVRSSYASPLDPSPGETAASFWALRSRRTSGVSTPHLPFSQASREGYRPPSPSMLQPMRATYMFANMTIEPEMFDALTFKPDCDDRIIVRYSPNTGAVTAASPPRLVAEITSPTFLDYELISDFFLSFRSFLDPNDLLRMLIARLRWAIARDDETGTVVRVRTFVAIRHWILNYFMDDFVLDYDLRVKFCELLNDFTTETMEDENSSEQKIKILVELKKCWRRSCAHYWDDANFDDSLGPSVGITPGGIAGHRDASLDPSFWEREQIAPPQLGDSFLPFPQETKENNNMHAEVSRAGHIGDSVFIDNRPMTPDQEADEELRKAFGEASPPFSLNSLDVVSCSFPGKALRNLNPNPGHPMAAHPVTSTSPKVESSPVATTPKALAGKRVRPNMPHRRHNSSSESSRESSAEKVTFKNQELLMANPFSGSLVRGNLLPPAQAFVDVGALNHPSRAQRQTTVFQHERIKDRELGSAMSGSGMKKLLGGVRRALSTRGQLFPSPQENLGSAYSLKPFGATRNRLPGTAVVPHQQALSGSNSRPPVRIDILGAEVAEDFKRAVREEAAVEAERYGLTMAPLPESHVEEPLLDYSAAHLDDSTFASLPQNLHSRPVSDMAITTGSKSIVIVDDTIPTVGSLLQQTNFGFNALLEPFKPHGADPTPPTTPPNPNVANSARFSQGRNQPSTEPDPPAEPLPLFIPDMATLGMSSPSEDDQSAHPAKSFGPIHPPGGGGSFGFHRRNRSARTHQSLNSIVHRRRASFASSFNIQSDVRSFDATSASGLSLADSEAASPMPHPLRVLRRRPGGNLRDVTNVGQLDGPELRKSRSLGSLLTYSDSLSSSFMRSMPRDSFVNHDELSSDLSQSRPEVFSLGQLAEKTPKKDASFFTTYSSKPNMRPSFEAEAQKLAQIPDDEDDGGVESALLKLEGRFSKKATAASDAQGRESLSEFGQSDFGPNEEDLASESRTSAYVEDFLSDEVAITPRPNGQFEYLVPDESLLGNVRDRQKTATGAMSFLSDGSHESYNSIPLLDRELTDEARSRETREWTDRSVLNGSDNGSILEAPTSEAVPKTSNDTSHLSFDFIQKTESLDHIKPGETAPTQSGDQSFLDDNSDKNSDLSSELSADEDDLEESSLAAVRTRPDLAAHPLGTPVGAAKTTPPPNPQSIGLGLGGSPQRRGVSGVLRKESLHKPLPPTPEASPLAPQDQGTGGPRPVISTGEALRSVTEAQVDESHKYSVHLPFILAFESEVLAQQFTLIEKDALIEIDWRELIEMQWKSCAKGHFRSWVDFLRNFDARGVEVVIARFNIMVKWAISEIVLTQNLEERARCIIKYIHIASHCRRFRNYATMAQLTIALSSNEVARLGRTWALVPKNDLKTLAELEMLVTPTRNFYSLRAEMETGSDAGCIPFVGIYTHDLLFNVQRPSEIASSPSTPPLVNFERYRIGAAVVKTLLRLLEASARYDFQPVEGITERCLWIGALSDDEIRQHSNSIQ